MAQLTLLPILWALDSIDTALFQVVVSTVILTVWPICLAVAAVLVWLSRAAERETGSAPATLVEAADNAVTMALISTAMAAAAALVILRVLGVADVPGRPSLVLVGWALVLAGVPALSWGRTLRNVWLPMIAERLSRPRD